MVKDSSVTIGSQLFDEGLITLDRDLKIRDRKLDNRFSLFYDKL
jgi:hypothetical protein